MELDWALQSEWSGAEDMQPGELTRSVWYRSHSEPGNLMADLPPSHKDHEIGSVMCDEFNLRGFFQERCDLHRASNAAWGSVGISMIPRSVLLLTLSAASLNLEALMMVTDGQVGNRDLAWRPSSAVMNPFTAGLRSHHR